MVAIHRYAPSACSAHGVSRRLHIAGQRGIAFSSRAAGDIHCGARCTQRKRDTLARPATGSGDHNNPISKKSHTMSLYLSDVLT